MRFSICTLLFTFMIFVNSVKSTNVRGYNEVWEEGQHFQVPDGSSFASSNGRVLITSGSSNQQGHIEVWMNGRCFPVPNGSAFASANGRVVIVPGVRASMRRQQSHHQEPLTPTLFHDNDLLFRRREEHGIFRGGEFFEKNPTGLDGTAQKISPEENDFVQHEGITVATYQNGWCPDEQTRRCTIC